MKYIVTMNQKKYEVEVERVSPFHMLTREEVASGVVAPQPVAPTPAPAPVAAPAPAPAAPAAPVQAAAPSGDGCAVNSPMPGTILSVKASVGQAVKAGETLFIMEAMKMETEIVAPQDGTIASIAVKNGDTTETDQVLAILK